MHKVWLAVLNMLRLTRVICGDHHHLSNELKDWCHHMLQVTVGYSELSILQSAWTLTDSHVKTPPAGERLRPRLSDDRCLELGSTSYIQSQETTQDNFHSSSKRVKYSLYMLHLYAQHESYSIYAHKWFMAQYKTCSSKFFHNSNTWSLSIPFSILCCLKTNQPTIIFLRFHLQSLHLNQLRATRVVSRLHSDLRRLSNAYMTSLWSQLH